MRTSFKTAIILYAAAFATVAAAAPRPPDARATYKRAVEAWRAGKHREAEKRFLEAATGPILTPEYARLYAGLSALRAGRHRQAAALLRELRKTSLQRRARWSEADALWRLGRQNQAARLYEQPGEGDVGLALYRSGQKRRLVIEEPDHPLAKKVRVRLSRAERIRRGRNLIERRLWKQAAAELDQVAGPEARYWAGMARYRTRKAYPEAAEVLLEAHARLRGDLAADALFHSARALSRADRDDEAIVRYRKVVKRYPGAPKAAEAALLSGWLEYNRGNYDKAIAPLEEVERRFPRSRYARSARWYAGWSRFLLGRYGEALTDFDSLLPSAKGELDEGGLMYWKATSLDRIGRKDEAKALWRQIQKTHPLSWYALLARRKVTEEVPPAATGFPEADRRVVRDKLVARVDELIEVGLSEDAAEELRDGEKALRRRHGANALGVLLDRYRRAGLWRRVYLLGAANGIPTASFPLAYQKLIDRYGPPAGNPPYYLYAIMRKESAFTPDLASYADAQGLLQMIPPTSRRVASALKMKYRDGLLYDPVANVRLGAWYIGKLLKKFGGQPPLGAGAYNAGPRAMMRWCDEHGKRPLDEFVELIPYDQTRGYVRKVTANYARYLHVYTGKVWMPPEKPHCKYAKDQINY